MHVMRCCITHVLYSGSTNDKSANGLYCFQLKDKTPLIIPLQTINVHALCSYGVFFPHHWTPTTSQQFFSAFSHFELLNFIPAIRCHTITQFSCSVLLIVMVLHKITLIAVSFLGISHQQMPLHTPF